MLMYLFCLLPPFLVNFFHYSEKNEIKNQSKSSISAAFFLLPLAIAIALKAPFVGDDTFNYNLIFMDIKAGSKPDDLEIGYFWFIKILTSIFSHVQAQHFVFAFLFFIVLHDFLKDNAMKPSRCIILFLGFNLFSFFMTGIRQSIAILICWISYKAIKNKKLFNFLLLILLAFLFHKTAIMFLPAYFLANSTPSTKKIPAYLILFIVVAFANGFMFEKASQLLYNEYTVEKTSSGYIMFAIFLIITILSFVKLKDILELNPNNKYIFTLNVIHMCFWILRLFSRTAERPSFYYCIFTVLIVEQLILTIKEPKTRYVINLLVVAFFSFYFLYRLQGSALLPYAVYF